MTGLQIFRAGRHRASTGQVLDFSDADLDGAIAAYDPKLHEAPLVVGHPTADRPAYGWVRSLARDGATMVADPRQVDAAFAEMVNEGRFKKISVAFYLPGASHNPTPGRYYLRHVGFLGAEPPAVKGLKDASFADDADDGVVEFAEVSLSTLSTAASLWRGLRDWMIGAHGQETADAVIPSWSVQSLADDITRADAAAAGPEFAEPPPPPTPETEMPDQIATDQFATREEELMRREADLAEREAVLAATKVADRRNEAVAFCEGLASEGRLLPADVAGMVEFMLADASGVIEFAEGDGAPVAKPAATWLRGWLSRLPAQVEFAELAAGGGTVDDPSDVDATIAAAHKLRAAAAENGQPLSFADAVMQTRKR